MQDQPLSISLKLSEVKTTIPIIVDNHKCRVRCANVSQVAKADDPEKQSIKFEYHLLDPAPTVDAGVAKPGFPLFENVTLYDKNTPPGEIPEWVTKKISQRIDAFLGTGDAGNKKNKPTRPDFDANTVSQMIGKEAVITVKAKTGDYEGNDITKIEFPGNLVTSA